MACCVWTKTVQRSAMEGQCMGAACLTDSAAEDTGLLEVIRAEELHNISEKDEAMSSQDKLDTRSIELSVEAITLVKAHIEQCNQRAAEQADVNEKILNKLDVGKNSLIGILLTSVGYLFLKIMGWL